MTIFTKAAATATAGLALVSLATASEQPVTRDNHAEGPRVQLVAQLGARSTALDASPDPTGKVIYYTTGGARPAIFRVPAGGGAQREILSGRPLRRPEGLAVSNDGKRLYVADTRAGHILVVPVSGARPHVLRGTAGSSPRGLEIQTRAGKELVVYTGKAAGKPAVLRIAAAGAARPSVVLRGAPLQRPDGVAISRAGVIYVTDHASAGGRALRIDGSKVTTVASSIRLGHPAGIALTLDETHLLVSSLNKATGTAQVVIVDLATGASSTFDDVIGENTSAGGLHRARAAVPMGWADVQRPGRIYRVDP